jgi:hypothetical protein
MLNGRISIKRTVLYDADSGSVCQCDGDFWKTCSLRVAGNLPCQEAIISITPIVREEADPASTGVKALDKSLADLTDGLRRLEKRFKL